MVSLKSSWIARYLCFPEVTPHSRDSVFERPMVESGLFKDATGKNRTLHSLRHTYDTLSLAEGVDIHTLARQIGAHKCLSVIAQNSLT
jgi:integrase